MPLARVLEHDDCCPLLLSLLSPARIGALLQTCRSFYGARPRAGAKKGQGVTVSGSSWRDLILVYPWNNVNGLPQVALFESRCTVKALRPESAFWRVNFFKVARRDRAIVVIDPGSFEMKAGFSCEDQPCVVIRTDVVLATLPRQPLSASPAPAHAHFNIGSPQRCGHMP